MSAPILMSGAMVRATGFHDSGFCRSRRFSSRSTASRIKAAIWFFPTSASMRSTASTGRRTTVGFTFIEGRPMRAGLPDIGKSINLAPKAISLIDSITDIGYKATIN